MNFYTTGTLGPDLRDDVGVTDDFKTFYEYDKPFTDDWTRSVSGYSGRRRDWRGSFRTLEGDKSLIP